MGDSLARTRGFPAEVRNEIGYALYLAQTQRRHVSAKPLHGFGSGVAEIAVAHERNAFRAVYVTNLGDAVYVLHAFQKKSRKGISTSKADSQLIRERLRRAKELARERER